MTPVDWGALLVVGTGLTGLGLTLWLLPRRRKPELPEPEPRVAVCSTPVNQVEILDQTAQVKYQVPGPVSRISTIVCTAHIEIPEHWINAPGWLAPDGQFFPALARGHAHKAFELIEPDYAARGLRFDDPNRNWERELEERGYAKYLSNPYWSGWTHTRRLTPTQRDAIADWFLFHQKKFPEWLEALY